MKTLLKVIGGIVLLIVVGLIGLYGYLYFEKQAKDQEQLSFPMGKMNDWEWQSEYHRVQIHKPSSSETGSILRKVNVQKKYAVVAFLNHDYTLIARAMWLVDCKPGQRVTTSATYSDGSPQILVCSKVGDNTFLTITVKWDDSYDVTWSLDYDGFEVYANFVNWDFSELKQEITLSRGVDEAKGSN